MMPDFTLLIVIFAPLLGAAMLPFVGRWKADIVGWVALLFPLMAVAGIVGLGTSGGWGQARAVEWPWIPALGINLSFLIDGLSLFFGLVVSGVGVLIVFYGQHYMKEGHYAHRGRFFAYLLFFMASMLGTVFADSLLLLLVFWEMTGVASYLLIGFLHEKPASQTGARDALLVTASTGLVMMVGILLLGTMTGGEYRVSVLGARGLDLPALGSVAFVLIMIGAFGKSAQFPFHFWLPNAMAAPTPVSAYLHSATMVKLGVFLTARIYVLFADLPLWTPLLVGVAFFTMFLGSFLSLLSNDLKAILAFATVSQLGYFIGFYGLGGPSGVEHDFFHIFNHVLYKAGLFMLAGIIDHAAGTRDIRKLGGLWRKLPSVGVAWILCALALAGLPGSTGFISKELMLESVLHFSHTHGIWGELAVAAVVLTAALNVAVACRLVFGVFFGKLTAEVEQNFHRPSIAVRMPALLLAVGVVVFGVMPGWGEALFEPMRVAGLHAAEFSHLALWHGLTVPLGLSVAAIAGGVSIFLMGRALNWRWAAIPRALRFAEGFEGMLAALMAGARRVTAATRVERPTDYLFIVIVFSLIFLGWFAAPHLSEPLSFSLSELHVESGGTLRLFIVLLISAAVISVTVLRRWTSQLIALSVAGFLITFYFVLYRAPDLALTQILVETASLVLMLILLGRFPRSAEKGEIMEKGWSRRRVIAGLAGLGTAVLTSGLVLWITADPARDPMGRFFAENTKELAHGTNAVNTILVDFRGFDTLGEITVLLAAALGCVGLVMRYKRTKREWEQGAREIPGYTLDAEGRGEAP